MIVAQSSELLSNHELFFLCLGEGGLQAASASEKHEKEERPGLRVYGKTRGGEGRAQTKS